MKTIKAKSIKENVVYSLLYQILAISLPLVTTPYLTRILGAENIGTFSFYNTISTYFSIFAMLGIVNYGSRGVAKCRDDREKLSVFFSEIYLIQLLSSFVVVILYIVYLIFISNEKLISLIMLLNVLACIFDVTWLFNGLEYFKLTVIRNIIVKASTLILIFLFVKNKGDLNKYCFILTGGNFFSQFLLWLQMRKYVNFKMPRVVVKKHFFGIAILFIPVIAISVYRLMDKIMIGLFVTKTELGYYELSERIVAVPVAIISAIGAVMLPRISNLLEKGCEKEKIDDYIKKTLFFAISISSAIGFGIISVDSEFIPLFFGEGYEKCGIILNILMFSCIFIAFANVIRTGFLIPNGYDRIYVISVILGAMVNLVFNILLIPQFGAIGAAYGTLFSEMMVCCYQCFSVRKELDMKRLVKITMPLIIFGVLMMGILKMLVMNTDNLVKKLSVKIVVGATVYLALTIPYGVMLGNLKKNK